MLKQFGLRRGGARTASPSTFMTIGIVAPAQGTGAERVGQRLVPRPQFLELGVHTHQHSLDATRFLEPGPGLPQLAIDRACIVLGCS